MLKEMLSWSENTQVQVSWVVTPCSVVVGYQCFGGAYFFHLQFDETLVSYNTTRRHNLEELNLIFTSVKTSNREQV